jgi:RNA polymerase sigma-70 factor (ECF subfamily)
MRSYAYMLAGSSGEADDLVQECLSRALRHAKNLLGARNLRTYLMAMLRNLYIDSVKKGDGDRRYVPLNDLARSVSVPPAQEDRLKVRDLDIALRLLPVEQRQVVLMVGLEGMSYQAVADVLRIPVGTVMSRLSRGREALRELTDHRYSRVNPGEGRRYRPPAHGIGRAMEMSGARTAVHGSVS